MVSKLSIVGPFCDSLPDYWSFEGYADRYSHSIVAGGFGEMS